MKLAFFVNEVVTEVDEYTTTRFARGAAKMGHEVWYIGVGDVHYDSDGGMTADGHRAAFDSSDDLKSFLGRAQDEGSRQELPLGELDALVLRNDSIEDLHERPWAVNLGVVFGHMLVDRGICVVNSPRGLARAASKLYLEEFPDEIRPKTLVSRDPDEVKSFIEKIGSAVLKPLYGAKGRNVFFVEEVDDPNLSQIIESVLEDGYLFVQERIENADRSDLRMFLLEGEIMEMNGRYAAIRRVPKGSDPRANISTGGKPEPAELGDREFAVAEAMKSRLVEDGMFFVGIDLIDDKVVEINAESPGGMQSVEHFTSLDFAPLFIDRLEEKARRGPARPT
ncbi:MAG: glutathione synthase [Actinomycetota bacterium]|nr:glutathione synthase [Actinomycetota bacterium]